MGLGLGYPRAKVRALNPTLTPTRTQHQVDDNTDPASSTQTHTEQLVRLKGGSFLCYTLPHSIGPVGPLPALRPDAAGVTFGSFNALAKMTPEVSASPQN